MILTIKKPNQPMKDQLMKVISKDGLTRLSQDQADITRELPGHAGATQALFAHIAPPLRLKRGVYRFKTHEEMNRQIEQAQFDAQQRRKQGLE